MSTHLLLVMLLAGPEAREATASPLEVVAAPYSADELQQLTRELVDRSRRVETFAAERDVPELVLLRAAVLASDALSRSERIQARERLDYCLDVGLQRLRRQDARLMKLARQSKSAPTSERNQPTSQLAGGAADAAQVRQLIDLIEATIQPESWAANGGLGTIRYWSPGYALVIRNTQAAHAEIGGLIGTLEAQQR